MQSQFEVDKNDFCFGSLLAAMLAITIAGFIPKSLSLSGAGEDFAGPQEASVALPGSVAMNHLAPFGY